LLNRQLTDISWAAVCHGAAIKGLDKDVVVNYVSRYNYGVVFPVNPGDQSYAEADREVDDAYKVTDARSLVQWILLRASSS
jgi:hypothetical protein